MCLVARDGEINLCKNVLQLLVQERQCESMFGLERKAEEANVGTEICIISFLKYQMAYLRASFGNDPPC